MKGIASIWFAPGIGQNWNIQEDHSEGLSVSCEVVRVNCD